VSICYTTSELSTREEAEQPCARQSDSAKRKRKKKQAASKLSFDDEEEVDDPETLSADESSAAGRASKVKRLTKDPKANTIGLPDRERDEADRLERERLRKEYMAEQERIKGETIEIVYSYWDGSGHRKSVEVGLDSLNTL
jgi:protein FAM50